MANIFDYTRTGAGRGLVDRLLALRAIPFLGTRHECPCCGWRLRSFTRGGSSLRSRVNGYCPRCNSKARHRRDWLYLRDHTELFTSRLRVLHVSPKYALSRRLSRLPNLDYIAGDLERRPHVAMRFDLTSLPLRAGTFDSAICIHVLEHIEDDRTAMAELFRVLRPGGWAFVSVPVRLDQPTYEDAAVTAPHDRLREFGETDHVRFYGYDLVQRLEAIGFKVTLDRATALDPASMQRYGLLADENIFFCEKPVGASSPD